MKHRNAKALVDFATIALVVVALCLLFALVGGKF